MHFFAEDAADMVAKKALRVNLSDLAAKGAKPLGFLLTLALPKSVAEPWVELFARGLGADAEHYECPLLGGDSVRTPGPMTISITAFGIGAEGYHGPPERRAGWRRGDGHRHDRRRRAWARSYATRSPRAKRWKLDGKQQRSSDRRYLLPQPRNALAEAVRRHASAAMDVSDGLAGDLGKLCDVSGVSAEIEVGAGSAVGRRGARRCIRAGRDGDGADRRRRLRDRVRRCRRRVLQRSALRRKRAGVPVTEIGRITAGEEPPRFVARDGKPMQFKQTSFSHF